MSHQDTFLNPNAQANKNYTANKKVENIENEKADIIHIVQNSSVVKIKRRPCGALNKQTASQVFNISTHCKSSKFEHVEVEEQAAEVGKGKPWERLQEEIRRQDGNKKQETSAQDGGDVQKKSMANQSSRCTKSIEKKRCTKNTAKKGCTRGTEKKRCTRG